MINIRCPICDGWIRAPDAGAAPDFPFCSPRCRLIDLGRWLGEHYTIAAPAGAREPETGDQDDAAIP